MKYSVDLPHDHPENGLNDVSLVVGTGTTFGEIMNFAHFPEEVGEVWLRVSRFDDQFDLTK